MGNLYSKLTSTEQYDTYERGDRAGEGLDGDMDWVKKYLVDEHKYALKAMKDIPEEDLEKIKGLFGVEDLTEK